MPDPGRGSGLGSLAKGIVIGGKAAVNGVKSFFKNRGDKVVGAAAEGVASGVADNMQNSQ